MDKTELATLLPQLPAEVRDLAAWASDELPDTTIELYPNRVVLRDGAMAGVLSIRNDRHNFRFSFGNTTSCPDDGREYVLMWYQVRGGKTQCLHSTKPLNETIEMVKGTLLLLFVGGSIPVTRT